MNALKRPAATLLELLVVIAIVAVLIGLLLAAIVSVRSASLGAVCRDRLRQLVLAAHDFHAQAGRFPPGTGAGQTQDDPYEFLCWHSRLLPHLGEGALWSRVQAAFAADRNFLHRPPHIDKDRLVRAFICPLDPRSESASTRLTVTMGLTSYLGVMGIDHQQLGGVLYLGSRTALGDITDGTSQTLFAGERPPSADERLGWWYAGWGQRKTGSADAVLGVRGFNLPSHENDEQCPRGPYRFTWGSFDDQCDAFHFWSAHPGGAHFGFADGSVKFLSYRANGVLPALSTRSGGEAVNSSAY